MVTARKLVFKDGYYYHVFNRGVDKRDICTCNADYNRVIETFMLYKYKDPEVKYSRFKDYSDIKKNEVFDKLKQRGDVLVDIIGFCLMPTHFHFLLRQTQSGGISEFLSNITNSYTKYFNTKYKRSGYLFQGSFKAVLIEDDQQLMHISRYIHLNPVASKISTIEDLSKYPWSSYWEYVGKNRSVCNPEPILELFGSEKRYVEFVANYADTAIRLHDHKDLDLD